MNSLDIIFSKTHLKSKSFWLSFAFVFIFIALLITPSIYFFYLDTLNIDALFESYGASKNNYPLLYNKIGELLPWVVVCLTALIVINGNTIFYFLTFNDELIDEKFQTKKYWFNIMTWLFVIWAGVSAVYLGKFIFKFTDLAVILKDAKSAIIADKDIIIQTSNLFNDFINQVEHYTIITIGIFILIDILSRVVKNKQMIAVETALKSNAGSIELNKTTKKLVLQKEFVTNQLFLIDLPILIGIILISLFTSQISPTIGNDMDGKYVFIAGGIGMHIIMSQVIFLILNLRYKFNEYKIDMPEQKQNDKTEKKEEVK